MSRSGQWNAQVAVEPVCPTIGGMANSGDIHRAGAYLAVLGGVSIDLRRAIPTPSGVNLNVAICCGGLGLLIPEGWRVHSDLKLTAGRVGDTTRPNDDPDAVTVYLTGFVVLGGVGVVAGSVAQHPI